MASDDLVRRETEAAAAEAGDIGGSPTSDPAQEQPSEAERPLAEAGQGEAEGFEQAEQELIEHASHGDQHAARRAIQDAPQGSDDPRAQEGAEGDEEYSSEREDNQR